MKRQLCLFFVTGLLNLSLSSGAISGQTTSSNDDCELHTCSGSLVWLYAHKKQQSDQSIKNYAHVFTYGQSLSRGGRANPVVSTFQPYNNLTFAEGVHAQGLNRGFTLSAFKPLVEEFLDDFRGETPTSGTLNYLRELIQTEDLVHWTQQERIYIGSAPGEGGKSLSELSKGTEYWTGLLQQVNAAKQLIELKGTVYAVAAMSWSQGEKDYALNTLPSDYLENYLLMYEDFLDDVIAITQQSEIPILVSYQLASHRTYQRDIPGIALALKAAADLHEHIYLATPLYPFDYADDSVHLTAEGARQLGKYYGRVIKRVLVDKHHWQPLEPSGISWFDDRILITLHVPYGALVIDTDYVTQALNYGFDLWADDNSTLLDIIESVEIVNTSQILISLSSALPQGAILSYARGRPGDPNTAGRHTGPRGNIRDSNGDIHYYVGQDERVYRMDNYLVMFEAIKP